MHLYMIFLKHAASLKNLGDKATSLFEKKKKEAGDIAAEKSTKAKTLAEEQLKKTTDAVSGATSGAQNLIGGIGGVADNAKSDAKDAQKKIGNFLNIFI